MTATAYHWNRTCEAAVILLVATTTAIVAISKLIIQFSPWLAALGEDAGAGAAAAADDDAAAAAGTSRLLLALGNSGSGCSGSGRTTSLVRSANKMERVLNELLNAPRWKPRNVPLSLAPTTTVISTSHEENRKHEL